MSYAATSIKARRETAHADRRRSSATSTRVSRTSWLARGRWETLLLIVIAILLVLGAVTTSHPSPAAPELASTKVRAGDTLWTVAAAHPVEGLTTAEVADLISAANGRRNALVTPGECILVPVDAPSGDIVASR